MLVSPGLDPWLVENPEADLHLSLCSRSGGEADEPEAERGLQRGRGPPHLLWRVWGRGPPAPVQDSHHPPRPQGEEGLILLVPSYLNISDISPSHWTSDVSGPEWWNSTLLSRRKDTPDLLQCSSASFPAPPLPAPDGFLIVSYPLSFPLSAPFTHAGQDSWLLSEIPRLTWLFARGFQSSSHSADVWGLAVPTVTESSSVPRQWAAVLRPVGRGFKQCSPFCSTVLSSVSRLHLSVQPTQLT